MQSYQSSIKRGLIGIIAAFSLIIVGMAVRDALSAMDVASSNTKLAYSNATSDLLLKSAGSWALERGLTNTALAAPEPASAEVTGRLAALRASGDAALAEALERLETSPTPEAAAPAIAMLQSQFETAQALRLETAGALTLSLAQRPPELAPRWVNEMTLLIRRSQDVRLLANYAAPLPASRAPLIEAVKSSMWAMSEFSGLERAHIGSAIAGGHKLDAARLELLSGLRGRLDQAWKDVRLFALGIGAETEIADAVAKVDTVFFGSFEALRGIIYSAGIAGEPYPIDAATWIDESTRAIDTILEMQKVAGGVMQAESVQNVQNAQVQLGLSIGGVLIGLGLAVAAILYVVRRVLRPLRMISDAMSDVANFRLNHKTPYLGRRDEMGEMAATVEMFRDNARVLQLRD